MPKPNGEGFHIKAYYEIRTPKLTVMSNILLVTGGPLMIKNTLVGLVSWGWGNCTSKRTPGVFVRVTNFLGWIKANTRGSDVCQTRIKG